MNNIKAGTLIKTFGYTEAKKMCLASYRGYKEAEAEAEAKHMMKVYNQIRLLEYFEKNAK